MGVNMQGKQDHLIPKRSATKSKRTPRQVTVLLNPDILAAPIFSARVEPLQDSLDILVANTPSSASSSGGAQALPDTAVPVRAPEDDSLNILIVKVMPPEPLFGRSSTLIVRDLPVLPRGGGVREERKGSKISRSSDYLAATRTRGSGSYVPHTLFSAAPSKKAWEDNINASAKPGM